MALTSGISPDQQRGLWYYWALRSAGERVMAQVFTKAYRGGTKTIKEHIFTLLANELVRKSKAITDENKEELYIKYYGDELRKKLDANVPIDKYDMNSLHVLFRNKEICGLAWADQKTKLEIGIQSLKDERNTFSHNKLEISEKDYSDKMNKLRDLLKDLLDAAEKQYSVDLSNVFKSISDNITGIENTHIMENMDPSNVDHYQILEEIKKQFRDQEEKDVWEEIMQEIPNGYKTLCCVSLGEDSYVEPHRIFVPMQLEQGDVMSNKDNITMSHDQLVGARRPDGTDPTVVILTGDPGMGKTTLMKLVLHHWMNKTNEFDRLSSYHLILFLQCRDANESIENLLQKCLTKTVMSVSDCDRLKEIVFGRTLIIIVDGYDAVSPSSEKLLKDVLALKGDHSKVFVTTRPEGARKLAKILTQTERMLTLQVLGIDERHQELFVKQHLQVLIDEIQRDDDSQLDDDNQKDDDSQMDVDSQKDDDNQMDVDSQKDDDSQMDDDSRKVKKETDKLMKFIRGMALELQKILHRPLNLLLLVRFWACTREQMNPPSSVTAFFELCRELMTGIVVDKLICRGFKESKAETICQSFLACYDELVKEVEVEKKICELKRKISDMSLPGEAKEELRSYFFLLCSTDTWRTLQTP